MRDVADILKDSITISEKMLGDAHFRARVRRAGDALIRTYRLGGRAYICGNGGSAAQAQHFAAELTGRFLIERPALPAEALHANHAHVTAVANDYGYDDVFSRALQASIKPVDTLVALTTSGRSRNVVRAAEVAQAAGATVIVLTGQHPDQICSVAADVVVDVPSTDTGRIQEFHAILIHAITEHVEHVMFA